AEQRTIFATQWAEALKSDVEKLLGELANSANLVASTIPMFLSDRHFAETSAPVRTFDLLIVLEAQDVTAAELDRVAGRARRCVLIGEPAFGLDAAFAPHRANSGGPDHRVPRPGLLQRLWTELH